MARRPATVFLLILLVGLVPRFILLPGAGFMVDQQQYYDWAQCGLDRGVFHVYQCDPVPNYPPLIPALLSGSLALGQALDRSGAPFAENPLLIAALKLPGLIFEIALIGLVFAIAYRKAGVGWAALVTAALYWNPGWLVITAWWGQTDAIFLCFMVLAAWLLARRQPTWMWAIYALAWLAKFQSILFLPVIGVLSLRRFGLRATLTGGFVFAAVLVIGELLFVLASGAAALTPFSTSVNLFPYISNGGYNFWFVVSGSSPTVLPDSLPLIGSITYFQAGMALFALATALICWRTWRGGDQGAEQGDEYLLFAAASLSFYMLPTQMGVRYLYPGITFLALAMIRDWRLVALYAAAALAFTHNVLATVWLGTGLLYYPAKLLFWQPAFDGWLMTAVFVGFMGLLLRSLWQQRARYSAVRGA